MLLTRSRAFTINQGNFESIRIDATISEYPVPNPSDLDAANKAVERMLDEVLESDLKKAGEISSVANTFVLTWLEENK